MTPSQPPQWAVEAAKEIQPKLYLAGEYAALKLCDRNTANECREADIQETASIIARHAPPQPAAQGDKEGGDSVLRSALLELTHRKDCEASAVDRQSERLTHLQNLCVGLRIELHPAALSSPPPPAADRGAPFDEKLS